MIRLPEGVVRLDGELPRTRHNLIVMHPWYHGNSSEDYTITHLGQPFRGISSNCYLTNVEQLLEVFPGNVFLFEESGGEDRAKLRLSTLPNKAGKYIIPTWADDPTPIITGESEVSEWDNLAEFLRQFGTGFSLAGGQLWKLGDSHNINTGCLGYAHEKLRERDLAGTFIEGCCFH